MILFSQGCGRWSWELRWRSGGELSADGVRRAARREKDGRAAARMYAIAHALDGLSRAEAARLAGMERQALRDAVLRYKAEGLAGLRDRPKGRPRRRLTPEEEAELATVILRGPDPAEDGCCAWTRADLCCWLEARFGRTYHPASMTKGLRRLGFSRQKARPFHPKKDPEAQAAFKKGGSPTGDAFRPVGDRFDASGQWTEGSIVLVWFSPSPSPPRRAFVRRNSYEADLDGTTIRQRNAQPPLLFRAARDREGILHPPLDGMRQPTG